MLSANGGKDSASNGKDHVFDLESEAFASDHFRMNEFKVKRCPRARPHDWTQCPFAHPGEKARRRDPRRYRYSGTACPEFRKSGCCRRGDACPFAHGVFECWLHPSRYRTQLCTDGTACKRRVCFFAHIEKELRRPEDDPVVAEHQVQAELAAEVQNLQQQHLTQALQNLLLQNTSSSSATATNTNNNISPILAMEMLKQTTLPQPSVLLNSADNTSTTALQSALFQHITGKEVSTPSQSGSESSNNGQMMPMATKPMDNILSSAVSQGNVQNALQVIEEHIKQNPTNLNLLTHLLGAQNSEEVPAIIPSPDYYDQNALSQALNVNGNYLNPNMMNNILAQNALKAILSPPRRSIDNSYLTGLTNAIVASAALLQSPVEVAVNHSSSEQIDTYQPMTSEGYPQQNTVGDPASSLENIQQLLQNPAFASNLSQLFQMNPTLLNQVMLGAVSGGNENSISRRSIDNAFLTRAMGNTDVTNGGIHNNNVLSQLALMQQLTNSFSIPQVHGMYTQNNNGNNISVEPMLSGYDALKIHGLDGSYQSLLQQNFSPSLPQYGQNQILSSSPQVESNAPQMMAHSQA